MIVSGRDIRASSGPSCIHVREVYDVVVAWKRATTGQTGPRHLAETRDQALRDVHDGLHRAYQ